MPRPKEFMKSGYEVRWTPNSLTELEATYNYLEKEFSAKELHRLSIEIEKTIELLSKSPEIFPVSDIENIRKVVLLRFITLYYRVNEQTVEIISFFSNRQSPLKRKLK